MTWYISHWDFYQVQLLNQWYILGQPNINDICVITGYGLDVLKEKYDMLWVYPSRSLFDWFQKAFGKIYIFLDDMVLKSDSSLLTTSVTPAFISAYLVTDGTHLSMSYASWIEMYVISHVKLVRATVQPYPLEKNFYF